MKMIKMITSCICLPKNRSIITNLYIPFVNHNPHTVRKQLAHAGLQVEKVLSVSNLRSPRIKKLLSKKSLVSLERAMQVPLAHTYFGPSTVYLLRKRV
jgi:hypothetical protein